MGGTQPEKDDKKAQPEAIPSPEATPAQKPGETLTSEQYTIAEQRLQRQAFMADEKLMTPDTVKRFNEIKTRKTQIDQDRQRLQTEAVAASKKQVWEKKPSMPIPFVDVKGKIRAGVEEKKPKLKEKLDIAGLGNDTNVKIIMQVLTEVVYGHFTETGQDEASTKDFSEKLDDNISFIFDELERISQSNPSIKKAELVEDFSKFTGTNFLNRGFVQPKELKEFLLLERTSYDAFIAKFREYLGLGKEKNDLEVEEANLGGKTLTPQQLIEQKHITFKQTLITAPAASANFSKDLEHFLAVEVPKALPGNYEAKVKSDVVAYLIEKIKKDAPLQPGETVEILPDGKVQKTTAVDEKKVVEEAQKDAEQKATQAASEETSKKPFSFSETFSSLSETFMEIMKWIFSFFGIKLGEKGGFDVDSLLNEWKDITEPERTEMIKMVNAAKKFTGDKIDKFKDLMKNPEEARRLLEAKKTDSKIGETWDTWFAKNLSESELSRIKDSTTTLEAKSIVDMLLSANTPDEKPAQPLSGPAPAAAVTAPKPAPPPAPTESPTDGKPPNKMMDKLLGKYDIPKKITELNALKSQPDWKQKVAENIGFHIMMFDEIRELVKDPENKLDPEIKAHLQNFDRTIGQIEADLDTKVKKLFNNPKEFGSEFWRNALKDLKKEPNWKATIEQKMQSSKDFSIQCFFMYTTAMMSEIASSSTLDAESQEVFTFLRTGLKPDLKKTMKDNGEEFIGFEKINEQFKKDFPGFEKALGFVMPYSKELIDQAKK